MHFQKMKKSMLNNQFRKNKDQRRINLKKLAEVASFTSHNAL